MAIRIVVMGVSGCGKTTIGRRLSQHFGVPYLEGDEFHPSVNVDKMRSGSPLTDQDRIPWLDALSEEMIRLHSTGYVVACSALKKKYRVRLTGMGKNTFEIVYLKGDKKLIRGRMQKRIGHYMPSSLLDSQFQDLEEPEGAIEVAIALSTEVQFEEITTSLKEKNHYKKSSNKINMTKADIGIIGLGVMGKSLARNFAGKDHKVAIYNAPLPGEEHVTESFAKAYPGLGFIAADSLNTFAESLTSPRVVLLMVKAGEPVDIMIGKISPLLEEGDIIIDAGNSFYKDSIRRYENCKKHGLHFVGMGVSGGEEGALLGPSMMPAGSDHSKVRLLPMLEKIAAKADGRPCVGWMGQDGAGHFIKMIHNGIEYADMQLLSEVYGLYKDGFGSSNKETAHYLEAWKDTNHNSYLLDITIDILRKEEDGIMVLDTILDVAGHKGTGMWTSQESLSLGVAAPTILSAMTQRILSSEKELREKLDEKNKSKSEKCDHEMIKEGILFCRLIALAEGFHIISVASKKYGWDISISEIVSVWRGGCIIRSDMLLLIKKATMENNSIAHLFEAPVFMETLRSLYPSAIKMVAEVTTFTVAIPAITSAINYYKSMVNAYLPVNMIQAQRDYFGAHTYRKIDDRETPVHTQWY